MSKTSEIYDRLPAKFTRQDVLKTAKEVGASYATANKLPEKLIFEGKAQRLSTGKYQKTQ